MDFLKILNLLSLIVVTKGFLINSDAKAINELSEKVDDGIEVSNGTEDKTNEVFDGVYSECFLYLSYTCLQRKTWLYLKELDKLDEVSLIGGYVKFVKVNTTQIQDEDITATSTDDLSLVIDAAVNNFFNNHVLKFNALGKDITVPRAVEEFVGRKRKGGGGGGGGGGHGGHGGDDDGGKKKMMMMAMMCMKMKLMMMVPAMMGMMGMMSFKGMMFSMMSFMISKMMLLMKILEKKGGGGGGGGDGGWAAGGGGGGGGAWMPAGGQDYGGGGGGGGYDANGQWQSRSIIETLPEDIHIINPENKQPTISSAPSKVRYNNIVNDKPLDNNSDKQFSIKKMTDEVVKINQEQHKTRRKRSIVDVLQNAYLYWINRMLGATHRTYPKYPKFKVIQGVKYVYYPLVRNLQKLKMPKEVSNGNQIVESGFRPIVQENLQTESPGGFDPIVATEDFNRGEIMEVERRSMGRTTMKKIKKFHKDVNEAIDSNPWE